MSRSASGSESLTKSLRLGEKGTAAERRADKRKNEGGSELRGIRSTALTPKEPAPKEPGAGSRREVMCDGERKSVSYLSG